MHAPVSLTLAGALAGARSTLPLVPGITLFGMAFGAASVEKGFSTLEATLQSAIVFAGLAQMVALEGWLQHWTIGTLLALALLTMTVNMRHVLMGASLRPWFSQLPAWQAYAALTTLTDNNWASAMRYRAEGGSDAGYFVGAGLVSWAVWVIGTFLGHLLGGGIPDPRRLGVDLVVPAFFIAMLVPNWRGRREAVGWGVAGAVSIAVSLILPGWWFIAVGAIAGAVAGGYADD